MAVFAAGLSSGLLTALCRADPLYGTFLCVVSGYQTQTWLRTGSEREYISRKRVTAEKKKRFS